MQTQTEEESLKWLCFGVTRPPASSNFKSLSAITFSRSTQENYPKLEPTSAQLQKQIHFPPNENFPIETLEMNSISCKSRWVVAPMCMLLLALVKIPPRIAAQRNYRRRDHRQQSPNSIWGWMAVAVAVGARGWSWAWSGVISLHRASSGFVHV